MIQFINQIRDVLPLSLLLFFIFVLGAIIGSLLNVCIYRIPFEKSILWPGSRCGSCLQPIRWYDNIPLVSYWLLRGRCRTCGVSFSIRYWLIELLTAGALAGLFYLEIIENIHGFEVLKNQQNMIAWRFFPDWQAWFVWGPHALLVCFLMVASVIDLDHREIPLGITIPGTVLGLATAVIFAWPWPYTPAEALQQVPPNMPWWNLAPNLGPRHGLYPWPFWGPLPQWFAPGGNLQTGLVTGLAGLLFGTLMLRLVRFLFGLGLGIEALGLGDADLMMMAGAFLGWQPVLVAFFIGVFAGLLFGVVQMIAGGDNQLPFGPSLAVGIILAMLCWRGIGTHFQPILFNGVLLGALAVTSCVLMVVLSYAMRLLRLLRAKP